LKISIFGNTNNVPFAIALGLKKLGVDVSIVINRKEALHRPESRYSEYKDGYPPWVLDASDISDEDFITGSYRVGDVVNFLTYNTDAIIYNSIGPSLANYCNLPHISFLTGSDVTYYASYETLDVHADTYDAKYLESKGYRFVNRQWHDFITRQRNGIASSVCIHVTAPGLVEEIDDIMLQIGVRNDARISNYVTHAVNFKHQKKTKTNPRTRILNGARLNWVKPFPGGYCSQDDKGTDILIAGFKLFIEQGNDAELVMIRKGLHIEETEALIKSSGISDRIVWLEEMNMQVFYKEILKADIVCDQFGPTTPGLVAMDAMIMSRPVVANFNLEILKNCYSQLDFVCDAQTATQVAEQFSKIVSSQVFRNELCIKAKQFVEDNCSPEAVAQVYLDKLRHKCN